MKFNKIIGDIDPKIIELAEGFLSKCFYEISLSVENNINFTKLGGDPLLASLMLPSNHIATCGIQTAATDGIDFYWNPYFVSKLSSIGLRLLVAHEGNHALLFHTQRHKNRDNRLWNISIDYCANKFIMDDLKIRLKNSTLKETTKSLFNKHLGNYLTLNDYLTKIKKDTQLAYAGALGNKVKKKRPLDANAIVKLTEQDIKEISERQNVLFYADENLDEDLTMPEKIYDLLLKKTPVCSECGKIGFIGKKEIEKYQKDNNIKPKEPPPNNGESGSGDSKNKSTSHSCKNCGNGNGVDLLGDAETFDDHIKPLDDVESIIKKMNEVRDIAKKFASNIPANMESKLEELMKPKIRWQDSIRLKIKKSQNIQSKNDWTRLRYKQLSAGMIVPKRKGYKCKFAVLLDCSGSMTTKDITYGVSQLQGLNENSTAVVVPCDTDIYWNKKTELSSMKKDELQKIAIHGRGGTTFSKFFSDYQKEIGKDFDFIIVITDGYLSDKDIKNMKKPNIDTFWLITSTVKFDPPFGRAFYLED